MPEFLALPQAKEKRALLKDEAELPQTLLSREAYLIGGGIKDGFLNRLNHAQETPSLAALELVGAAAVGAGLNAMTLAGGRWRGAAQIGTQALKILAVCDGARRLVPTAEAVGDTMINPDHYLQNRSTVASYLGTACFDYPVLAVGGLMGSSAVGFGSKAWGSLKSSEVQSEGLVNPAKPFAKWQENPLSALPVHKIEFAERLANRLAAEPLPVQKIELAVRLSAERVRAADLNLKNSLAHNDQPYPAPDKPYPAPDKPYPAPDKPYPAPDKPYPAPDEPYPTPGQY